MALISMTGFARSDGSFKDIRWHWEIRTVNGRGLDLRFRLPSGYESLEQAAREACAQKLSRGNCVVTLNAKRLSGDSEVRLNQEVLQQIMVSVQKCQNLLPDAKPPSVDGILGLKGVLEVVEREESEGDKTARHEAMFASFQSALEDVCTARTDEGTRLTSVISDQVKRLAELVQEIENSPARGAEQIEQKLSMQIERLLGADSRLEKERLHQEAVLLAVKADVAEEIDRLKGHIVAAQDLLRKSEPVGRKFDFLAQEFNREVNTICSKSNDGVITGLGLEAKSVIDQMREQIQNVE